MNEAKRVVRPNAEQVARGLLAGFVAWLLPGAGHFMLGQRARAAVFFVLVSACIGLGLLYDGNLALHDKIRAPWLSRLQVASNLAMGPIEPVIRRSIYGELIYSRVETGERPGPVAQEVRKQRFFKTWSGYGTAYFYLAGLMNILLILDAWDLSIGRRR